MSGPQACTRVSRWSPLRFSLEKPATYETLSRYDDGTAHDTGRLTRMAAAGSPLLSRSALPLALSCDVVSPLRADAVVETAVS